MTFPPFWSSTATRSWIVSPIAASSANTTLARNVESLTTPPPTHPTGPPATTPTGPPPSADSPQWRPKDPTGAAPPVEGTVVAAYLMLRIGTTGPVVVRARLISRSSAANNSTEGNTVACLGRKTLVPSARVNSAGVAVSSGGLSRREASSAASTIAFRTVSRSVVLAKRSLMVWWEASACRFQRRQVERFSPTTATTRRPISAATSGAVRLHRLNGAGPFRLEDGCPRRKHHAPKNLAGTCQLLPGQGLQRLDGLVRPGRQCGLGPQFDDRRPNPRHSHRPSPEGMAGVTLPG